MVKIAVSGWTSFLLVLSLAEAYRSPSHTSPTGPVQQICESESFKASCWENQVILMTSAYYGRMHIGRCVEANLGYLGCNQTVLDLADKHCSGKRECEILVPNIEFDTRNACYKELKVYLEASYTCVRATPVQDHICRSRGAVQVGKDVRHLANTSSSSQPGCSGYRARPLTLEAQAGQTINLTLVDYATQTSGSLSRRQASHGCINYGHIVDSAASKQQKNVSICGGQGRVLSLYSSKSNKVQLVVNWADSHRFMIAYQAVGCPDLRTPRDAWLEREGDEVVVGCDSTRQTWHLKCQGTQWHGVIGNCTQHLVAARNDARTSQDELPISHGVAIVIIVGVAIIICIVIVVVGIACLRNYKRKYCSRDKGQIKYNNVKTDEDCIKSIDGKLSEPKRPQTAPRNKYTPHPWQLPLPDPLSNNNRGLDEHAHKGPGVTAHGRGHKPEDNYHASIKSDTESSRYFVLERDSIPTDNTC